MLKWENVFRNQYYITCFASADDPGSFQNLDPELLVAYKSEPSKLSK